METALSNRDSREPAGAGQIRVRANAETESNYANDLAQHNSILGAMDWIGKPEPHARQDIDASLVTPADGKPEETKKALYVVASSRVPRMRYEVGRFYLRLPVLP